jgi:hypothetical protein
MLLCDCEIKSYSYLAAMQGSLPQGEFIIASRNGISIKLATLAEAVSKEAFAYLFTKQGDEHEQQEIQEYSSNKDNQHATLEMERAAVYKYIGTKGREEHGSRSGSSRPARHSGSTSWPKLCIRAWCSNGASTSARSEAVWSPGCSPPWSAEAKTLF